MKRADQSGFTLVELAIVIAIIGLVAGGVIGGQSLIRSSKVNKVLVDAHQYIDAKIQFRSQYGYLPGDFPSATRVWGKADGSANLDTQCSPVGTASPDGMRTCNGNGDGVISGQATGGTGELFENFRAWQHLGAAKLITGNYTGINTGGTASGSTAGTNVPVGPLDNTAYFMWSWSNSISDDGTFYAGNYNNTVTFGANAAAWPDAGALTPTEAAGLDTKADDGLPGMGGIRAIYASRTNCTSTTSSLTAKYVKSSSATACTLVFLSAYRDSAAQ